MSQDKEREYGGLTEQQVDEIWQRTGRWGDMQSFAKALIRAALASPPSREPLYGFSSEQLEDMRLRFAVMSDFYSKMAVELIDGVLASPPSREVEPLSLMEKVRLVQKHLGNLNFAEEAAALILVCEVERKTAMKFVAEQSLPPGIRSRGEGKS